MPALPQEVEPAGGACFTIIGEQVGEGFGMTAVLPVPLALALASASRLVDVV